MSAWEMPAKYSKESWVRVGERVEEKEKDRHKKESITLGLAWPILAQLGLAHSLRPGQNSTNAKQTIDILTKALSHPKH